MQSANSDISATWDFPNVWAGPGDSDTNMTEEEAVMHALSMENGNHLDAMALDDDYSGRRTLSVGDSSINSDSNLDSMALDNEATRRPLPMFENGHLPDAMALDNETIHTNLTAQGPDAYSDAPHDTLVRRAHPVDCEDQSNSRKRVAVSGPSQRALDDLREREEISRHRALQNGVRIRNHNEEVQRLQQEHAQAVLQNEIDQDIENEMAEQILQYERQLAALNSQNRGLAATLHNGQQQYHELQKTNEEMKKKLHEIANEHAREKEQQNNEVLALRQRLHSIEIIQTQPSNTDSNMPLPTSRTAFRRGAPTRIGVVPLRPVVVAPTASNPGGRDEDNVDMNTPEGFSNVRSIVHEVLQQLNVSSASVENKCKSRKRRSARTRNREAISDQKKLMEKRHDLAWKDAVRNTWKISLNVNSIADFGDYTPASLSRVQAFETGDQGPGDSMTLDFGKGYEKSRWNKVILSKLCADLLNDRHNDGSWGLPDVSNEYLTALFSSQLKQSREAWRLVQARPNFDEQRMETSEEVIGRVAEYTDTRLATVGSRSRRERKHERRTRTVEKILCLKSDAPDFETWKYFQELLKRLSVDGMSSEEEGVRKIGHVNVPVFCVKLCTWRHPAISDYLKYIDQESQNPAICSGRGSKPHPRIPTDEIGSTLPPPGLPEKLFDEEWLKNEERTKGRWWIDEELLVSRDVFELLQFVVQ